MANQEVLFDVLRRFARTMAGNYDIADALHDLSDDVVAVFGATAAGVALCDDGQLRFVTATSHAAVAVEEAQERTQSGPCYTSIQECHPVPIRDVRGHRSDWPEFCAVAERQGFSAVLGLPLILDDRRVGSLDVYDTEAREWPADSIAAGAVLADIAAAFLLNASELAQSQRTTAQLQTALTSRIVIEQAKGKLSAQLDISLDEAFDTIRQHARSHNLSVRSVSRAVLEQGPAAIGRQTS